MSTATAKSAYSDCFDIFDEALGTERGIRISQPDRGAAQQLYTRLQYARTLDRRDSREIYEQGDPQFDASVYDVLVVRQPRLADGKWWVYVERRQIVGKIEVLGAAE